MTSANQSPQTVRPLPLPTLHLPTHRAASIASVLRPKHTRKQVTGANGANVDYLVLTSLLTNSPVAVVFTQMAFTNRTLTLTGTGPSGGNYRVWATTNITLPATNWSIIPTGTFNGGMFMFTDSHNTNFPGRFYRLSAP